jgi:hypothetical protein
MSRKIHVCNSCAFLGPAALQITHEHWISSAKRQQDRSNTVSIFGAITQCHTQDICYGQNALRESTGILVDTWTPVHYMVTLEQRYHYTKNKGDPLSRLATIHQRRDRYPDTIDTGDWLHV